MFAPFAIERGWHYNARLDVYQKVKGRVFVYVSRLLFGYKVQLYLRGRKNMIACHLEARTSNPANLEKLFEMGEEWLKKYQDGDLSKIQQDMYAISNPDGVWRREMHLKKYWIN